MPRRWKHQNVTLRKDKKYFILWPSAWQISYQSTGCPAQRLILWKWNKNKYFQYTNNSFPLTCWPTEAWPYIDPYCPPYCVAAAWVLNPPISDSWGPPKSDGCRDAMVNWELLADPTEEFPGKVDAVYMNKRQIWAFNIITLTKEKQKWYFECEFNNKYIKSIRWLSSIRLLPIWISSSGGIHGCKVKANKLGPWL